MNILFELSKEHSTLPRAEVLTCLHAEDIPYTVVETNDNVLVIKSFVLERRLTRLATRLSHTFYIDELLCSCPPSPAEINHCMEQQVLQRKGSIAVRGKNRSTIIDSQPILDIIADRYTSGRTVRLQHPDIEIRVFITDNIVYIGRKISQIQRNQFEQRKVQHRPFFSPISLHPKLARALVNLSCIRPGETLLDPFCGTGGILLEAGLLGAQLVGNDIEKKMITGCKETLEFYNIKKYTLFCSDIGNLNHYETHVDAIVTDFPYGKATTTKGEDLGQLYKRAFETMYQILKKGKRAVVGLPQREMIALGEQYFTIQEIFAIRVHRSLTRYFVVYQK
ncbi:MAG: DNA methyltransferase [Methanobacteriota archaeon]